jgi:uncharacterized membrane protein
VYNEKLEEKSRALARSGILLLCVVHLRLVGVKLTTVFKEDYQRISSLIPCTFVKVNQQVQVTCTGRYFHLA